MQLAQYLMAIATRHERAIDAHEEEMKELRLREKRSKSGRHNFSLTYNDEIALLKGVISWVRGKPACLKKLSSSAIGSLAYIFQAKVANDPYIEGYEIVDKLVYDPEKTINYLNSFGELKEQGWIRLIDIPGKSFTEQPPFSWLQSYIELGDTFHKEMGASQQNRSFSSNDYLDSVFAYLNTIIRDDTMLYKVREPATDLATYQPEGWFRRIALKAQDSTCTLHAENARKKYSLSILQHLTLLGMLGQRDGDINHDFNTPTNVTSLFAYGRVCRKLMMEHLFGESSPLMRYRLLEGSSSSFGESVQLTQRGIRALLGKHDSIVTFQELKNRIKKQTLFDYEVPMVNKDSLLLPPKVMEAIRSVIFCESSQGMRIRKEWQLSLPSAWGSPTGSTMLLYGPPGTGKSLTAQYLASELKRPLIKIDAAQVLSCWLGESEKNLKRIFDDYSMLQQTLNVSPVLLFNEADQLLGARGAGSNSVDRSFNSLQNLLLEGLERFSGILVATTNRRDLLDEAFSRRFTYKLELPAPDRNLRIGLWKSHLPMKRLAEDVDIGLLADHGLSGGEIRLVIERTVRLLSYRGITTIDHKTLADIAREELTSRMKRNGPSGKIGFGAANS